MRPTTLQWLRLILTLLRPARKSIMPPELLEAIKTGGAALVPFLAYLYWQERAERLKEREEHKTVAKDMVTAMVKTEATLATLGSIFMGGKTTL